jgi:AraC-like DNA-binding protein
MTLFDHINLMARGGAIALLILWSWLLLRDHGKILAAQLAVAMNAAICCYLLVTIDWFDRPRFIGLFLALGAGATPGLFWLFAKAWFNDETQLRKRDMLLVAASVGNTLFAQLTYPMTDPLISSANIISGIIFRIIMLSFAAAALREVWRGREGDLIEGRRKLRMRLVAVVSLYVIVIALSEAASQNGWILYQTQHNIGSFSVVVILAFCMMMFGMRQSDLFGSIAAPPKPEPAEVHDTVLINKLKSYMQSALPYRDETLSIAKLAAQLGEQEYRLRRTINQQMGHRNFAAFLNSYRLAEVKAALTDISQKDVPIITIALDAGFGSLGPFNRAFREAEGMTPSEFRTRNAC